MKIYLMRHAEADSGDQLDPTRSLTKLGKTQARMMGKWLSRQTEKPEVIIESNMRRSRQTAKRLEVALGAARVQARNGAIDPDSTPEAAWDEIMSIGETRDAKSVIAVSHGPLVEELMAMLTRGKSYMFHFAHGAVAHFDDESARLHWLVTPNTVARDEDEADAVTNDAIVEAALGVAEECLHLVEKKPQPYYYDEIEQKRLVLGDGGESGNCEYCEEAADMGWIDMDDVFPGYDDEFDQPPLHINCTCQVEYRTHRVRMTA